MRSSKLQNTQRQYITIIYFHSKTTFLNYGNLIRNISIVNQLSYTLCQPKQKGMRVLQKSNLVNSRLHMNPYQMLSYSVTVTARNVKEFMMEHVPKVTGLLVCIQKGCNRRTLADVLFFVKVRNVIQMTSRMFRLQYLSFNTYQ